MKKSYSILFPKSEAIPITLYTYQTGMHRQVALSEAKNIIVGALLRGDFVFKDTGFGDDATKVDDVAEIISIIDKDEKEAATNRIMESDKLLTKSLLGRSVFVVPEQVRGVVKNLNINTGKVFVVFEPDPLHFPDEKYDGWYFVDEVRL